MDDRLRGWIYYSLPHEQIKIIIEEEDNEISTFFMNKELCPNYQIVSLMDVLKKKKCMTLNKQISFALKNNTDATIMLFIKSRNPLFITKYLIRKNNYKLIDSYMIVPSFANPRWFFRLNRNIIRNSGNIVKPSRITSIIAWKLMQLLNWIGYPQLLFYSQIILIKRNEITNKSKGILIDYLESIFKRNDLDFILYTGACGYYQKYTAQVMDKSGNIIAYAKIGHTEQAKNMIYREANVLKELGKLSFSSLLTPQIISVDTLPYTSDIIMLQTPHSSAFKDWSRKLTRSHVHALAELFATKSINLLHSDLVINSMEKSLLYVKNTLIFNKFDGVIEILEETLSIFRKNLVNVKIPFGLSHGDFSPWNVYIKESQLYIFDWEHSENRTPLWDIYNFILHSEIIVFKKRNESMYKLLADKDSVYSTLIDEYRSKFDSSIYFDRDIFLIIYLFEISLFYIKYCNNQIKIKSCIKLETIIIDTVIFILKNMLNKYYINEISKQSQ
jgi:thiamine kinase-like enzyme